MHTGLKCRVLQINCVPLNYCLDLKKWFCLTACNQVYNEIVLVGNHTRMDGAQCWSVHTLLRNTFSSHLKNCPKLLWKLNFFSSVLQRIMIKRNESWENAQHMSSSSLFLSFAEKMYTSPLESETMDILDRWIPICNMTMNCSCGISHPHELNFRNDRVFLITSYCKDVIRDVIQRRIWWKQLS